VALRWFFIIRKVCLFALFGISLSYPQKSGQSLDQQNIDGLNGVSISAQWFLSYQYGEQQAKNYNSFLLKRGYVNIKKKFNDRISARITPDVSVDGEGDGRGDIEMRLKYCYIRYGLKDLPGLTNPYFEFGVVHRPWLEYEQHINDYRVEGTMFLERVGILNSADYGITFVTLLGEEMDEPFQQNISHSYPGRYGSFSVGVYNGGGYHAVEENENKSVETRLSIRPLPDAIPGLQLSYHGVIGKGNKAASPDWRLNTGFLSWQHQYFVATATYFKGTGNSSGSYVDNQGNALQLDGYSFFTELKPVTKWSVIFRYDKLRFSGFQPDHTGSRWIGGIAYHFMNHSKFLLNYDHFDISNGFDKPQSRFEIAVELRY